VNWESRHRCKETAFIIQEIPRAKSDTSAPLHYDSRPMALLYGLERRLEDHRSMASVPFRMLILNHIFPEMFIKVDMVLLEPTSVWVWQSHGSAIAVQRCAGIRLGTRDLQRDRSSFCTSMYSIRIHERARFRPPKIRVHSPWGTRSAAAASVLSQDERLADRPLQRAGDMRACPSRAASGWPALPRQRARPVYLLSAAI
jgi:hypothetical protein